MRFCYWDSNVFLDFFSGESGKVDLCEATLEQAKTNEMRLAY